MTNWALSSPAVDSVVKHIEEDPSQLFPMWSTTLKAHRISSLHPKKMLRRQGSLTGSGPRLHLIMSSSAAINRERNPSKISKKSSTRRGGGQSQLVPLDVKYPEDGQWTRSSWVEQPWVAWTKWRACSARQFSPKRPGSCSHNIPPHTVPLMWQEDAI